MNTSSLDDVQLRTVANQIARLDRKLGQLADQPALQRAPDYTRAYLTEIRDELMRVANVIHKSLP